MRRRLAFRLGLRQRDPVIVAQVERLKALLSAALRGDETGVGVLLHAIGFELGHLGYYTTCTFLAEHILRAEGIGTPLSGTRLRRRLVVLEILDSTGRPVIADRPASPQATRTATALRFVTAYGNGDFGAMLTLWASVRDHPDPGYLLAFVAEFLQLTVEVSGTGKTPELPTGH